MCNGREVSCPDGSRQRAPLESVLNTDHLDGVEVQAENAGPWIRLLS